SDEENPLIPGNSSYRTSRYPRYDRVREEELLNKIVQRAAENFIDISNTHATERLQPQDTIDRASEYREVMNEIKLDTKIFQKIQEHNTLPKLRNKKSFHSSSQPTPIVASPPPHVVLKEGCVTKEDEEWAMSDINRALEDIEVEYV
ncbi:17230_t:CDS:2, partial [Acaulospora colombiana]